MSVPKKIFIKIVKKNENINRCLTVFLIHKLSNVSLHTQYQLSSLSLCLQTALFKYLRISKFKLNKLIWRKDTGNENILHKGN
jgi:hypothetical protein